MRIDFEPAEGRVLEIARAVVAAGGRAFLVGGLVRDRVRATLLGGVVAAARDFDVEAHGLDGAALRRALEALGPVKCVGEAFAVYKLAPSGVEGLGDVDVSIPRRDSKTGRGHRGFTVEGDPSMTVEEAARRRDFTINSMLWDPLTGEVLDPFGGVEDLRAGRLRAVDPRTFGEDSLRVLRAMQFAARFGLAIDPATVALCRAIPLDDLPAERVWGEMEKLLLAPRPSTGLAAGLEMGVMDKIFPDLRALVGCTQEPDVHPEGDVWVHTLQAVDVAAAESAGLDLPRRLAVLLATLCHDLGKPATWKHFDGRVRFHGHEGESVEPARRLLDRLNVHTRDGFDMRSHILRLVEHHLAPSQLHRERERVGDSAFRRLSLKCDLELLVRVARADMLGRRAPASAEASPSAKATGDKPAGKAGWPEPSAAAAEWFEARAKEVGVAEAPPSPILLGRHVLDLGVPPGPRVGKITDKVYQLQLDGEVKTLDEAVAAARLLLDR